MLSHLPILSTSLFISWSFNMIVSLSGWQWAFIFLWLHRYVRLIVNTVSHWVYSSKALPLNPQYTSKDVTVIIPTIHNNFEELTDSLQSILACQPKELILVTTAEKYRKLVHFTKSLEASNIQVLKAPIANKRIQVCEAIPLVTTSFLIMADDDVTWPKKIIPWLLAPFESSKTIGAVGPSQRVKRLQNGTFSARAFNWLGAAYIERRNFEISATHGLDGGTSCMSGRTCAFRTEILKCPEFLDQFKTERWGKFQLNADDDNFITRYLVNNNWDTWIQYNKECEIETTLENNTKYFLQCTRWARSNWRSNFTSLITERTVWRRQPWCVYALHIATFTSLSIAFDPLIILTCLQATADWSSPDQMIALYALLIFMFISKVVKLIGLFIREPKDIGFLPVSILFGYIHGLVKLYALFTLFKTSWGSRADGDANDSHRMSPRAHPSETIEKHRMPFQYKEGLGKKQRQYAFSNTVGNPDYPYDDHDSNASRSSYAASESEDSYDFTSDTSDGRGV